MKKSIIILFIILLLSYKSDYSQIQWTCHTEVSSSKLESMKLGKVHSVFSLSSANIHVFFAYYQ